MIRSKIKMLLIVAFLTTTAVSGQTPRVYSKYNKPLKATVIYTDKMHLFNTPEQVINVEFNFRLKQRQSQKQAESVELTLWSYPRELEYRKDEGRDLSLIVDGSVLKVEKVKSEPFQKRKQKFERFKGTYSEWITLSFSPGEAKKLALAKTIKLRSGNQEFDFKDIYVNIIRDFAGRIPQNRPFSARLK